MGDFMNYVIILIATIMIAVEFVFSKFYQSIEGAGLVSGLKFNALNGLFTALIFFGISGFKIELSLFSLIMAFAFAISLMSYSIIGFYILEQGGMAVYSIFLMSGGMLLPYLYGVKFLDEEYSVLRLIGVIIILAAVIFSNKTKYSFKPSFYFLCVLIFILNGFVSITSKAHQVNETYFAVSNTNFVMYAGAAKFLLSSIALLFCKKDKKLVSFNKRTSILAILGGAVACGLSFSLQLIAADKVYASILYPLITGGTLIFSAVAGFIFFKEKITKPQFIGISLCVIGTLFFL